MYDVVALGELLIDFTPLSNQAVPSFEQNPGGAPANVLVSAAGMGMKTCFIGQVGEDAFGYFLRDTLVQHGVDTRGLLLTPDYHTTLAFVHLAKNGERSFSFYRDLGADAMLSAGDVDESILHATRVFHFGAVSMTQEPVRSTTLKAAQVAKAHGAIVTYDPNVRLSLWESEEEARSVILEAIPLADVLKVSSEELEFLTGSDDVEDAAERLANQFGISLILVTLGAKGCFYYTPDHQGAIGGFSVESVDTTGAGDAFMGAFIAGLIQAGKSVNTLTQDELTGVIRDANASGALATTKRGGIPSLPNKEAVHEFLLRHDHLK